MSPVQATLASSAFALLCSQAAVALLIDDFSEEVPVAGGDQFVVSASAVGGELDAMEGNSSAFGETGGAATIQKTAGRAANFDLVYDGTDGAVNRDLGLGGVDVGDNGASDRLLLDVLAVDGPVTLQIHLFATHTDFLQSDVLSIAGPGALAIPFADFTAFGAGASLAAIHRIELSFRLPEGFVTLGSIRSVPEPGTGVLLGLAIAALAGPRGSRRQLRLPDRRTAPIPDPGAERARGF